MVRGFSNNSGEMFIPLTVLFTFLPGQGTIEVPGRLLTSNGKPVAHAAVWLSGGIQAAELPRNAVIDQRGKTFEPHVLVVPRGTTVAFLNNDTVLHNVYAQFDAKRFDLGLYPKGQIKRQLFDKVGVVSVRCNIHAQMSAYILVVDTPYYAVTDKDGRFKFSAVPPGTYRLQLWHESGAREERPVEIKAPVQPLALILPPR